MSYSKLFLNDHNVFSHYSALVPCNALADLRPEFGRGHVAAPVTWVWVHSPPEGSKGRALSHGVRRTKPPDAERFFALSHPEKL